jgi:phosphoribosylformylglycinamidine cyclo-ligase
VWSGGETPTLKDIILPDASLLSGSAVGMALDHYLMRPDKIEDGDRIIFLESNGIHANGLTLARKIAAELPDGYLTKLPNGSIYGEELLKPTPIYVPVVYEIFKFAQRAHYAVNITGHGWRKLMRAPIEATYIIETMPELQPIFTFLQTHAQMNTHDAYGTFNMGAGFALYVAPENAELIISIAATAGIKAYDAGYIQKPGTRSVFIKPYGIEFAGSTLNIR